MLSGFSLPALLPCRCLRGVRDWAFFQRECLSRKQLSQTPRLNHMSRISALLYGSATLCILNHWYSKFVFFLFALLFYIVSISFCFITSPHFEMPVFSRRQIIIILKPAKRFIDMLHENQKQHDLNYSIKIR